MERTTARVFRARFGMGIQQIGLNNFEIFASKPARGEDESADLQLRFGNRKPGRARDLLPLARNQVFQGPLTRENE